MALGSMIELFARRLRDSLPEPVDRIARPAATRTKTASAILREFKRTKGSSAFWEQLADALAASGVYVDQDLTQAGIRSSTRFRFSRVPFDDPILTFTRESSLSRFVEDAIGRSGGPFSHLQRIPRVRTAEFKLPNGRRIDLLCRERATGTLVAIELKAGRPDSGVVDQLRQYLVELRRVNPGKNVRGVIVSAPSLSQDAEDLVARAREIDADWYFYRVEFELASSHFATASVGR